MLVALTAIVTARRRAGPTRQDRVVTRRGRLAPAGCCPLPNWTWSVSGTGSRPPRARNAWRLTGAGGRLPGAPEVPQPGAWGSMPGASVYRP